MRGWIILSMAVSVFYHDIITWQAFSNDKSLVRL